MAVTLQQIADRAGVSRGTVDRALNNRGRIRPEVAEEIKKIANEMGYRPNRAGRALAMAKRSVRIGAILQEAETPFIQEVIKGILLAKDEVEYMGGAVVIKQIVGRDAQKAIKMMEDFKEDGMYAIALNPTDDNVLKETIDRFVDEYNIPIITLNSDIDHTKRLCYVGQNARQCGKTAAGLMSEMVQEDATVAVISGYLANPCLELREEGFVKELQATRPGMRILPTQYTSNSDKNAEDIATQLLSDYPDLRGIFITSQAEIGVCKVLEEKFPDRNVKIIANDFIGERRTRLLQSKVNFLLQQDPYVQGFEPIMILFRLLFQGEEPKQEYQYTDINIRTKHNI
ncbi:MAG: LacI family DNA-binding transcriptional regulator [Lachnospiraceae bacterium]